MLLWVAIGIWALVIFVFLASFIANRDDAW
jgi:hypothetical protein